MKLKILTLLLLLSSLLGYLQWGKSNSMFLFEAEAEIFSKLRSDPMSVLHPFTVLPLLGQLLLLFTLFQKQPNRILIYLGMSGLGLLLVLILFIGIMSLNAKQILFSLPFLTLVLLTLRLLKKIKKEKQLHP